MRSPNDDDGMHRRVGWMVPADEHILEFLSNCRDLRGGYAIQTPGTIAANTSYSNHHIGNRCRTLADHGLVERIERGKYRLSERGESLLDGGVDPEELDD